MAGSNSSAQNQRRNKGGLGRYIREVRAELKKVVWPTKKELINYTIVVFITVLIIAGLIGIVDSIFNYLFKWLMHFVG